MYLFPVWIESRLPLDYVIRHNIIDSLQTHMFSTKTQEISQELTKHDIFSGILAYRKTKEGGTSAQTQLEEEMKEKQEGFWQEGDKYVFSFKMGKNRKKNEV